jgi:endonuclease/exonuclease/phosphatase family metal-dependent hydrolase
MKRPLPYWISGWLLAGAATWLIARTVAAEADLTVMTYNLRYASDTPPNAWPQRRPVMKACLESVQPDVFGTQEGLYRQLKDLAADLPGYDWIGTGRDGGSRGEFMAVFYRRDRLEPLEFDHFWLSDTPHVIGSSTWGNTNRRMVTWVRFRDRQTGTEFYFWNTHLDHALQPAREKGAALIRERVAALKTSLPVFLVGDFNANAGANPAYDRLTQDGGFQDTWLLAGERGNAEFNSFNGFETPRKQGQRIDWILLRGEATVARSEIVTFAQDGQVPSDHYPVVARVRLHPPKP